MTRFEEYRRLTHEEKNIYINSVKKTIRMQISHHGGVEM